MKKILSILPLLALTTFGADTNSTQRREIITTSQYTREAATNETAAGWRNKLGVSASGLLSDVNTNQFQILGGQLNLQTNPVIYFPVFPIATVGWVWTATNVSGAGHWRPNTNAVFLGSSNVVSTLNAGSNITMQVSIDPTGRVYTVNADVGHLEVQIVSSNAARAATNDLNTMFNNRLASSTNHYQRTQYNTNDQGTVTGIINDLISGQIGSLGGFVSTGLVIATTAPMQGGGALNQSLNLTMTVAGSATNGYLRSNDWSFFYAKQPFSVVLSNLANTGAMTNQIGPDTGITFTTNGSGVILISATGSGASTNGEWGLIAGTITDQDDLVAYVDSLTGVIGTNGATLTYKFTQTGTNAIRNIATNTANALYQPIGVFPAQFLTNQHVGLVRMTGDLWITNAGLVTILRSNGVITTDITAGNALFDSVEVNADSQFDGQSDFNGPANFTGLLSATVIQALGNIYNSQTNFALYYWATNPASRPEHALRKNEYDAGTNAIIALIGSSGGANLVDITNTVNAISGVVSTNGDPLNMKFSQTGTNQILGLSSNMASAQILLATNVFLPTNGYAGWLTGVQDGRALTNLPGYWATSMLVTNDVTNLSIFVSSAVAPQNAKLQWLLDRATNAPLFLLWDTKNVAAGLRIHPNTIIQAHEDCGGVLLSNANVPLLANANIVSNQMLDYNIVIDGGVWNGSHTNQQHNTDTNGWNGIFRFFGVRNLTIRNVSLINSRTFAAHFINVSNVIVENTYINFGVNPGTPFNSDGLHFNGPASNIKLRNIRGLCNDDLIALNANEPSFLPNPGSGISYTNLSFYMGNGGDITDVDVDGVIFQNQWSGGIRLLSSSNLIDRVRIANVSGIATNKYLFIDNYIQNTNAMRPQGPGYFGSISLENWSVEMTGNGNSAHGTIATKINTLNISGWRRFQFNTDKDGLNNTNFCPSIEFLSADIEGLNITECVTLNTNVAGHDGRVFYFSSGHYSTVNLNNNSFLYPNGDGTGDNGNNWPVPIFQGSAFVNVLAGNGNVAQGFSQVANTASTVTNNFMRSVFGTTGSMKSIIIEPTSAATGTIGSALTINNTTPAGPYTSVGATIAQAVFTVGGNAALIASDRALGNGGAFVQYVNNGTMGWFVHGADRLNLSTNGLLTINTATNINAPSSGTDGLLGHNLVRNSQLSAASNAIIAQISGGGVPSIGTNGGVSLRLGSTTNVTFVGVTVVSNANGNALITFEGGTNTASILVVTNFAPVLGGVLAGDRITNNTGLYLDVNFSVDFTYTDGQQDDYAFVTNGAVAFDLGAPMTTTPILGSFAAQFNHKMAPGEWVQLTNRAPSQPVNVQQIYAMGYRIGGSGGSGGEGVWGSITGTIGDQTDLITMMNATNGAVIATIQATNGALIGTIQATNGALIGTIQNTNTALLGQINAKAPTNNPTLHGTVTMPNFAIVGSSGNTGTTNNIFEVRGTNNTVVFGVTSNGIAQFSQFTVTTLLVTTNYVTNLFVFNTNGFVMTATDGTLYRVRLNNSGSITTSTPP